MLGLQLIYLNIMFLVHKGLMCAVPGMSRSFSVSSSLCTFGHLFQLLLETFHLGEQCARKPKGAVGNKEVCWELACGAMPPSIVGTVLGLDGEGIAGGRKNASSSSCFACGLMFFILLLVLLGFPSQQHEITDLFSRDPTADPLPMPTYCSAPGRSKTTYGYIYFLKKDLSGGIGSNLH